MKHENKIVGPTVCGVAGAHGRSADDVINAVCAAAAVAIIGACVLCFQLATKG